jgi:hypothetical protein
VAVAEAELARRAAAKFSRAASMLFTRPGLEQATSEGVARHRAARFGAADGGALLDLCCGIGGDLIALAACSDHAIGIDIDPTHAAYARHNVRAYDRDCTVATADVREVAVRRTDRVFVDPARRSGDRRGGSMPPLEWCVGLPAEHVCVKTAPGLDLAGVPDGWEVEFVAVNRDLKEAALWSPVWATAGRRATVLPAGVTLVAGPATPAAPIRPPGRYLLDPSPAVTRAGAVADLAATLDAWQVDRRIAFLCTDTSVATPFARCLEVAASLPFSVRGLRAELRRLGVGAVDIRRRGLAGDVDELRQRLGRHGDRPATVVLTRVVNKPWSFVCFDLPRP